MTLFKAVVSWLAFLWMAWRGTGLLLVWALDRLGIRSIPLDPYLSYLTGLSGSDLEEVLHWSTLWGMVAAAIASPWIVPWVLRLAGRGKVDGGQPFFLMMNLAGRWSFAILVVGGFLDWWPEAVSAFFYFDPSDSSARLHGVVTVILAGAFRAVLAAALIAPECTQLASSGLTGFIDSVFFPGGREKLPPYTLKLARSYRDQERWEESENEYARMLSFYPDRLEAWQERLAVSFRRRPAGDPSPEDILALGLRALKDPTDREALHEAFLSGREGAVRE